MIMELNDVVILAGGKGTRMEADVPKPLVSVKGKPIISHQIDYFSGKVKKIILSLGHRADEIIDYVKKEYKDIVFSVEDSPRGTAGGLRLALEKSDSEFVFVINSDDITDIDLKKLREVNENAICVCHPRLPFGRVIEKDGYAVFEEKPLLNDWVSCGWYMFKRKDIMEILPNEGSLEYDVFPKMRLRLFKHEGLWAPLNNKKQIKEFEEAL